MSAGTQAIFLFLALLSFCVGAVIAWLAKAFYATVIALGLAFWVFVPFWIAVKA